MYENIYQTAYEKIDGYYFAKLFFDVGDHGALFASGWQLWAYLVTTVLLYFFLENGNPYTYGHYARSGGRFFLALVIPAGLIYMIQPSEKTRVEMVNSIQKEAALLKATLIAKEDQPVVKLSQITDWTDSSGSIYYYAVRDADDIQRLNDGGETFEIKHLSIKNYQTEYVDTLKKAEAMLVDGSLNPDASDEVVSIFKQGNVFVKANAQKAAKYKMITERKTEKTKVKPKMVPVDI